MEIIHQLGELFQQALPTVAIVFLFYLFLRWAFFLPIQAVLAERKARTEGTWRDAEARLAAAQEKLRAYQEALRKARGQIFAEQEAARRALFEERSTRVRDARNRSSEEVRAAKQRISAELEAARAEIDQASQSLAGEIARAIVERRQPRRPVVSEGR